MDKLTWAFGSLLIITGIVLFVLKALYNPGFMIAGTVATGSGGGIFLLGLLMHCCLTECGSTNKAQNTTSDLPPTRTSGTTNTLQPLAMDIETRAFFESKGVFGLPQELINKLDTWRKFRTSEKFNLSLDAGFILYGSPGTGKTTIAKCIAELLGGEYCEKTAGDLCSRWHGATEKNITELFNVPDKQFRVAMIDEISGILPKRGMGYGQV